MRLQRHGKKGQPFYHIVIADGRAPRDGRYIEKIGTYNPIPNPADIVLNVDKALDWLQKGAQPSDTVRAILSYRGILYKHHLLKGVKKGALTEAEAEAKFQAWMKEKDDKIAAKRQGLLEKDRSDRKSRLEAETRIKEDRAAELAKQRAAAVEEKVKEAQEKAAEVSDEAVADVTTEEPVTKEAVEAKVEEAAAEEKVEAEAKAEEEVKEEPKAEEKAEAEAKAEEEVKEEPKAEEKAETEAKAEEEPKVEEKDEVKKEAKKKESK